MDSERSRYRSSIFTTNIRFSAPEPGREAPEPGREAPEPGRDAPVAHTATLIACTCMLVSGDRLWWAQDTRDEF